MCIGVPTTYGKVSAITQEVKAHRPGSEPGAHSQSAEPLRIRGGCWAATTIQTERAPERTAVHVVHAGRAV